MLAWLCAGILGLGCWGLPAAAADNITEPTTQVTTEAETETESSKFSTKDLVTAVIVFTLVTAGTATGVFVFRWKETGNHHQILWKQNWKGSALLYGRLYRTILFCMPKAIRTGG